MTTIEIVLGIILLLCALFLVVAVLMQQGKQKGLSGSISGGADTFFGKEKGKTIDKVLSKATTVIAIVFVVVVLLAFFTDANFETHDHDHGDEAVVTTTVAATTEEPVETTAAETTVAETASETVADTTVVEPVETTAPSAE